MIVIPDYLKAKLMTLDRCLHRLGVNLYGRKLFKEYTENNQFHHFTLEVHINGAFTLHFQQGILGFMENKRFGVSEEDVLNELELLTVMVENKLKIVNAS